MAISPTNKKIITLRTGTAEKRLKIPHLLRDRYPDPHRMRRPWTTITVLVVFVVDVVFDCRSSLGHHYHQDHHSHHLHHQCTFLGAIEKDVFAHCHFMQSLNPNQLRNFVQLPRSTAVAKSSHGSVIRNDLWNHQTVICPCANLFEKRYRRLKSNGWAWLDTLSVKSFYYFENRK